MDPHNHRKDPRRRGGAPHRGIPSPEEFLAELPLGLGKVAFKRERYDEAERYYREVVETYGTTPEASEAAYWAGVSARSGRPEQAPGRR